MKLVGPFAPTADRFGFAGRASHPSKAAKGGRRTYGDGRQRKSVPAPGAGCRPYGTWRS